MESLKVEIALLHLAEGDWFEHFLPENAQLNPAHLLFILSKYFL